MTKLLFILILAISSCSGYTKLEGPYFSNQQDCLVLDDKDGAMENKHNYIIDGLDLKQTDQRLKFRSVHFVPRKFLFKHRVRKYKFKILYKSSDSFMVSPSSKLAKTYFNNRDSIVFKSRNQFPNPNNSFTRIIFHSSRCFGRCNDLHLEVAYSGNLKVTNNGDGTYGSRDSSRNDNYFGKLSAAEMEKLKTILKFAQLPTLEWPQTRKCFDAPDLTIIIYQNEKRYYFKMNAPCVPIVSRQLTSFLTRLFKYEALEPVDTAFTYER